MRTPRKPRAYAAHFWRGCRRAGSASRPTSRGRCCSSPRRRRISIPDTSSMPTAAIRRADMTAKARIAVIGAGLMGHGIAQVFALAGHDVTITDSFTANLDTVKARISANLADLGDDADAVDRVTP